MAAAAALEAADPGRAARVAARWREEMRRRQAPTTPVFGAPALPLPPTRPPPSNPTPRPSSTPQPHPATLFGSHIRKPWKYAYALEDLQEAKLKEAAEPGCHGHEIERWQRWCDAIARDEDSDDTDDDYRPPAERKEKRREREEEEELMGWESEVPFPDNSGPADYIDVDDILL